MNYQSKPHQLKVTKRVFCHTIAYNLQIDNAIIITTYMSNAISKNIYERNISLQTREFYVKNLKRHGLIYQRFFCSSFGNNIFICLKKMSKTLVWHISFMRKICGCEGLTCYCLDDSKLLGEILI